MMAAPNGTLVNQGQPPTRIIQNLTPVSIKEPVPGIFVAEFERVVAGWIKLTASGPAKTLITIHFGEKLHVNVLHIHMFFEVTKSPIFSQDDGTVFYEDFQHYYQNNFQTGGSKILMPSISYLNCML